MLEEKEDARGKYGNEEDERKFTWQQKSEGWCAQEPLEGDHRQGVSGGVLKPMSREEEQAIEEKSKEEDNLLESTRTSWRR